MVWGSEEDSMLLIGVYELGLGSWDQIVADPKLNFADKVLQNTDLLSLYVS